MPIHIQNSGRAQKGNLYTGNTYGLSGVSTVSTISNITELIGKGFGVFKANASTVGMPEEGKTWVLLVNSYDTTTANIISMGYNTERSGIASLYYGSYKGSTFSGWTNFAGKVVMLTGTEDLNNLQEIGATYYTGVDSVASTITNSPVKTAFSMQSVSTGYGIAQVLRCNYLNSANALTTATYCRAYNGTTWGSWRKLIDNTELATQTTSGLMSATDKAKLDNLTDKIYPVGSIYMSMVATDPKTLFGGTWVALPSGKVLVNAGTSSEGTLYEVGKTGGSERHSLTVAELVAHNHTATSDLQGNHIHSGTTDTQGAHNHTTTFGVNEGEGDNKNGSLYSYHGNYTINPTTNAAGNHSHSLNISAAGIHSHNIIIANNGGGKAFNIMQPYLVVYMWKRTV